MAATKLLVTGGSRSGKTAYAEAAAGGLAPDVVYIATASVRQGVRGDGGDMAQRIAAHRRARPQGWTTVEEPVAAGRAIREHAAPGCCIVLDCITLWLSNVLGLHEVHEGLGVDGEVPDQPMLLNRERLEAERIALLSAIEQCSSHLIVVTNELGSGVVPMGKLTRFFVDEHGWTNQRIAERCDSVVLTVSGVPVKIKSPATPSPKV